ncbi:MAG: pyruvate dehydrogenase (acetyl-transferring), homodimeric type [Phycisphaerales bacterium]|nr:pyruvate dehydrogenase (acetyl-transferring), homodimeric type [Phycisphaerales bacterium]MCB9854143.1 pyruvate dehydrogenase (acetyl-transferring), homodimeric type [Phycisphaerales bacterium]MCB9864721.1 pyruvate dehydrogenase (acetyl-transferring), homodimeric type [Phycisphaerales bacterium]
MHTNIHTDWDPTETREWIESLTDVVKRDGSPRARFLLRRLREHAQESGVPFPFNANTPYVNTIPREYQAPYPGDRAVERRLKSIIRWNAMCLVVRANRRSSGIGGHISTFASNATLLQVGLNHFFRANTPERSGDQIYFQGHASPGLYARAFLEGRLTIQQMHNFRRELADGGGLSSYPHPWLMPDFWEFPTVSMGLASISAIYQARFNRYLQNRGLAETDTSRVWAFLGDGETDEPESLGAITLASREKLDNLTFVINCNLQRLDGPVRGNGNIIQELEAAFSGAGWNVIKVLWGDDWDPLFAADKEGLLTQRMHGVVDGQWQKYSIAPGKYIREHFFGTDERLLKLVENHSDHQLEKLRLGGHDPEKVYAAYKAAVEHEGQPTVILARTIKGYGLGEAGEGRNVTHQQKKLNDQELKDFRDRFDIPISDKELRDAPFYRPPEDSPEAQYLRDCMQRHGGPVPRRYVYAKPMEPVGEKVFAEFFTGSGDREASTTMAFVRMLSRLLADKKLGPYVVPIVPDEARTFGMEGLFQKYGIYAHAGQKYEPVDSHTLLRYHESKDGQILEEGITEAGSLASFTAAGTAYATHGVNMIPFYTFYSMFGFQRVGDSIWAAGDQRTRGFLMGATAGRTTLAGEGLQHQDGNSHLMAMLVPNLLAYDPAFAFELAVIIQTGIDRMFSRQEDIFYYITIENEPYAMPAMPDHLSREEIEEGIIKGMYLYRPGKKDPSFPKVHLFGSGSILNEALRAQEALAAGFGVSADVWSVTSYQQLQRDAMHCERWNRLHPTKTPKKSHFQKQMEKEPYPIIAASDYVKMTAGQLARFAPDQFIALGTDGFGRSEAREELRRFFEVDAESIIVAALHALVARGEAEPSLVQDAIETFGIDSESGDPWRR